jgi:3-oxoacyl-[acyl-carrier protein] reductase
MNVAVQQQTQQVQKKLAGKIAVVTGGARGIGAAIARRLAEEGATIVLTYAKSKEAADNVVASITQFGGTAHAYQSDAKVAEQVNSLVKEIERTVGKIDILVNNAGVAESTPIGEVTPEHIDHIYDTNVKGLILTTAAALKLIPDGGRIINISSVAAHSPFPNFSVYSSTKGAVNTLTKVWAQELGARKITVNGVAPGATDTDMANVLSEEEKQYVVSKTALGRLGEPSDIASVVAFLASADGGWVTGQTIDVDGGINV